MRAKWADKGEFLGGYRCCTHTDNQNKGHPELRPEYERGLFGEKGFIWEYSPGVYRAVEFRGDEDRLIKDIPDAMLSTYVKKLKVPFYVSLQLKYATKSGG